MTADPKALQAEANHGIPNNRLPALLYRSALPDDCGVQAMEDRFKEHGWVGTWFGQVFDFHHFHPNSFEVLGVGSGSARLVVGGRNGEEIDVGAGDALLLPPGWGHCQLSASSDFELCGAYPDGQEDYTIVRDDEGYDEATERQIAAVPLPKCNPIHGEDGSTLRLFGNR